MNARRHIRSITLLAFALVGSVLRAPVAHAVLITFDVDADGQSIDAPGLFADTTRLTDLYAALGVHFVGPGGNDGGAILDQSSDFGIDAHSGRNFLAISPYGVLSDGGIPEGPETVLFDQAIAAVSLFASGGFDPTTVQLEAFDANHLLIGSDSADVSSDKPDWRQLSVSSSGGIRSVLLTGAEENPAFIVDDLEFSLLQPDPPSSSDWGTDRQSGANPVTPEPSAFALVGLGLAGMVASRRRRSSV